MLNHLILIALLLLVGVYWLGGMAIKERALAAVKQYCRDMDVQMLDDYVALTRLKFARDELGKMRLLRVFLFEFSATGTERYNGEIIMSGTRVVTIEMEPYRLAD